MKLALLALPSDGIKKSAKRLWAAAAPFVHAGAETELYDGRCGMEDWLAKTMLAGGADILIADCGEDSSRAALRFAVKHGFRCVNGVIGASADGGHVIQKTCGSHLEWNIPVGEGKQVWAVSPAAAGEGGGGRYADFVSLLENAAKSTQPPPAGLDPAVAEILRVSPIPANPLPDARLLLVGGRGIGSAGAFGTLKELASLLGGQAGVTRAAALNGWGGMDVMVGQSGVVASPDVCVAFGVSGAAAFMAGVEKSRVLIAVNTDPGAPILRYADYGVEADAAAVAGAMLEQARTTGVVI